MLPRQGTPLLEVKICKRMNQKQFLTGGFSSGTSSKESTRQCRRCKRYRFDLWVGEIPWRGEWQPTPVFLPGKSMTRGAWTRVIHNRLINTSSFSVVASHSEKIKLQVYMSSSKNMRRETTVSQKLEFTFPVTAELANEGETPLAEQTQSRKQALLSAFSLYHFPWWQILYNEDLGRTRGGPGLTESEDHFHGEHFVQRAVHSVGKNKY